MLNLSTCAAQDLNEAQYSLFVKLQQQASKIPLHKSKLERIVLVGDPLQVVCRMYYWSLSRNLFNNVPHQAINSFRGAGSSIFSSRGNVSSATLKLTSSHRFGGNIAEDVTSFLDCAYGGRWNDARPEAPLIGKGSPSGGVLSSRARGEALELASCGNTLIVTRSNIGIIKEALRVCEEFGTGSRRKEMAVVLPGEKRTIINELDKIIKLVHLLIGVIETLKIGNDFVTFDEYKM